ncbi:tRNA pseudouridine(55) synthase TruB [Sphingosinicella sp. BN140058]|uniref:tRNA pseudouridine(55) synthase TruB n=1 Tax=Sphingosinicella sp. BN140058 TaxID=1892855 RepID=UPI0010133A85|nr:tRNA pseudouridine(55) synthase TruB [Sphingosinicella sp. BN140058]QAY76795.1 tRNA pseudouridine(55) synthase TruB [Sphingosinicella sp. BN140058]
MHGWLIIDKPVGPGSTDIVSATKRALRDGGYGKMKVGHGGTLDPLASGVLPIALGEATKLCGRMLDSDKVYEFTIEFGTQTDTLDREGAVVATSEVRPTLAQVEAVLARFIGPIEQVPPAYSAIKVDGKRAYDLARAGADVEMKTRAVTVHALEILPGTARGIATRSGGVEGPAPTSEQPLHHATHGPPPRTGESLQEVTLRAQVSKGTYIRSLARDIAHALESVGHVTMLRRTKAGPFDLSQAISLDNLREAGKARELEQTLLPLTAGLDDIPALPVTPDQARLLRQGRVLIGIAAQRGLHLATDQSVPVALVEAGGDDLRSELRVVRGFNL